MIVHAAPLGLGPSLPGTLVANFDAAPALAQSPLRDFTFLAVASPDEASLLEQAARQAAASEVAMRSMNAAIVPCDAGIARAAPLDAGTGACDRARLGWTTASRRRR